MTTARLVIAVLSTSAEEAALWALWRWGLPHFFSMYLPKWVIIAVMVAWALWSALFFMFVTQTLRKQRIVGLPTMMSSCGRATTSLAPEGMVTIRSELWQAESVDGNIDKGAEILVVGEDGLKLMVRKLSAEKSRGEKA